MSDPYNAPDPYQTPGQQPQQYGQPPYGQPQAPYGQTPQQPYPAPYEQTPYGQAPYGGDAPQKTNGMAIASLATSVGGFLLLSGIPCPVGLILGIIALKQIKERGEQGRGMALAGVIVGAIGTGLMVLAVLFFILLFAGMVASPGFSSSY